VYINDFLGFCFPEPPLLKLSLMYKCLSCGEKFRPPLVFWPKKCPYCGGKHVKVTVGMVEKKPNPFIVH
jgi:DNA-directed RNA polymerase subunit RPC12/RpoP